MAEISQTELDALLGREVGCSDWVTVDQKRISTFAEVTEDWQPIHLDPAAGQAAGFEGTVAHGFLTLSLMSAMAYSALPLIQGQTASVNYGFDRVRFLTPVPAGARLRTRFTLASKEARADGGLLIVLTCSVEIEGQQSPALLADWRILYVFGA